MRPPRPGRPGAGLRATLLALLVMTLAVLACLAAPARSAELGNASPAPGHGNHAQAPDPVLTPVAAPVDGESVSVTERLGNTVPDVSLRDESGREVRLAALIDRPTILVPVYYSCPNDCNVLLMNLSRVLPEVGLVPGRDFQVVTVSFDETDTPDLARRRKNDFTTALSGKFPKEHWHFLTGEAPEIKRLMDAVGFGFRRQGRAFQHAIVLVAVSPSGTITRYLHGGRLLPFDIAMAATEAAQERTGLSVTRAVAMCYSYDPQGRRYVFDFMKVAGAVVLSALALFGLFLAFGGKKRRPDPLPPGGKGPDNG